MYLGLKAVFARSFARIHEANLINVAILPLTFANEADYDGIEQGDEWEITGIHAALKAGSDLVVKNLTKATELPVKANFSERQVDILMAGGLLNYVKSGGK